MLEGCLTEDLENRWRELIKLYKLELTELQSRLASTAKIYDELTLIRKELKNRDVEVEDECRIEENKKIF